jgi:hypothetical protein
MTKQKSKVIARKMPQSYPLTEQQLKFRQVIADCGIVKGISREDLIDRMKNCVPEAWKKLREEKESPPSGQPISATPPADS